MPRTKGSKNKPKETMENPSPTEVIQVPENITDPVDKALYKSFVNEGIILEEGKVATEAVKTPPPIVVPWSNEVTFGKRRRNVNGLLTSGVEYKQKSDGSIDWEAMFNPEYFVYPNGDHSKDPLLKADGLRDLAEVRGVIKKEVALSHISESMVICAVTYHFIPNIDDPEGRVWTAVADATPLNIGGKSFSKYLSTIAETRATGRCIREALGIRLCTFEEVSKDDLQIDDSDRRPVSDETIVAIKQQLTLKGISEPELLAKIQESHPEISSLDKITALQGKKFLRWLADKQNVKTKI